MEAFHAHPDHRQPIGAPCPSGRRNSGGQRPAPGPPEAQPRPRTPHALPPPKPHRLLFIGAAKGGGGQRGCQHPGHPPHTCSDQGKRQNGLSEGRVHQRVQARVLLRVNRQEQLPRPASGTAAPASHGQPGRTGRGAPRYGVPQETRSDQHLSTAPALPRPHPAPLHVPWHGRGGRAAEAFRRSTAPQYYPVYPLDRPDCPIPRPSMAFHTLTSLFGERAFGWPSPARRAAPPAVYRRSAAVTCGSDVRGTAAGGIDVERSIGESN